MSNSETNQPQDGAFLNLTERKRWLLFGLPFTFTKYRLTNKALLTSTGFFKTVEESILLFRVLDTAYQRTLFQKIFGLGTIIISSSDKTTPHLEVKNIKHSRAFLNTLVEQVEQERLRLRFRTGELTGQDGDCSHDGLDDTFA